MQVGKEANPHKTLPTAHTSATLAGETFPS